MILILKLVSTIWGANSINILKDVRLCITKMFGGLHRWVSVIQNNTEHRAVSLRLLSFLSNSWSYKCSRVSFLRLLCMLCCVSLWAFIADSCFNAQLFDCRHRQIDAACGGRNSAAKCMSCDRDVSLAPTIAATLSISLNITHRCSTASSLRVASARIYAWAT